MRNITSAAWTTSQHQQHGPRHNISSLCDVAPVTTDYISAVMYGGFQGGPQLGPPDAERRQSLGQL